MSGVIAELSFLIADLAGTFVFALSGALLAVRKGLDGFGVLMLAGVTGLGGGFTRDVLIGDTPPMALENWWYLLMPVAAAALTFAYHPAVGRMEPMVWVFDALGLALFVVAGASKAMAYGLGPIAATLMGLVTGIGGGMIRDLLGGRVPVVLSGDLYAIPGLTGAAIVAFGIELGAAVTPVMVVGAVVCATWRLMALWRGWNAPRPRGSASV